MNHLRALVRNEAKAADLKAAGVELAGDIPFMVAPDSADVWARRQDFRLDARVGVPPDAFSATGNLAALSTGVMTSVALYLERGDGSLAPVGATGRTRGVMGKTTGILPPASPLLFDRSASLDIQLAAADQALSGATMQQLALLAHGWHALDDTQRAIFLQIRLPRVMQAFAVGGLLALPLPDTLKSEAGGRVQETVSREHKWLAQTPQMFRLQALHDVLAAVADNGFAGITDEASAMERLGLAPLLVEGSAQNFKVTYPADFALAEAILRSRA